MNFAPFPLVWGAFGGGASASFTIIQTPAGTYPTATGSSDVLTYTSSDSSVTITGNATTDTVDFKVSSSFSSLYVLKSGSTMTGALTTPQINISGGTSPFFIKWNSLAGKYEISASADATVWTTTDTTISGNTWKFQNGGAGTSLNLTGTLADFLFPNVNMSGFLNLLGGAGALTVGYDSGAGTYAITGLVDPIRIESNVYTRLSGVADVTMISGGNSFAVTPTYISGLTAGFDASLSDSVTGAQIGYNNTGNINIRTGNTAGNLDLYSFGYTTHTFNSSGGDYYNVNNAFFSANHLTFQATGAVSLASLGTQDFTINSDNDFFFLSNQQGKKTYFNTDLILNDPYASGEVARIKVVSPNSFGIGSNVLSAAPTSGVNGTIAIGRDILAGPAGQYTGWSNTFIGAAIAASGNVVNANNSVAIGEGALYNVINGSSNTAVGGGALYGITNENNLLAFGSNAGQNATGASDAVYIGTGSGSQAMNSSGATYIGTSAGAYVNGQLNIMIGAAAGVGLASNIGANNANENIYIGGNSGLGLRNGSYNINIGGGSGAFSLRDGNHNLAIGYDIALSNIDGNGQMSIKNALFGSGLTATGSTIPTNGLLGAFVASPTARLDIIGSSTSAASLRIRSGSAPTTPNDGDVWYDSTDKALNVYVNNIMHHAVGSIFSQTTTGTVANTTSETTITSTGGGSLTLPANFLTVGKTLKLKGYGFHSTSGTPTLRVKLKMGSTVLLDTGVQTSTAASNDGIMFEALITCRTTGETGTVFAQGFYAEKLTNGGAINHFAWINTAATTIDTTTTQAISVTMQWGTASASNTISLTNCTLEVVH